MHLVIALYVQLVLELSSINKINKQNIVVIAESRKLRLTLLMIGLIRSQCAMPKTA